MRGIAALFVVLRHTWVFWQFEFVHSYLAVDLFFILSGFVLCEAYGDSLRSGELGTARFMGLRWIRLYPVYLLSVLVSALIALARTHLGAVGPVESSEGILGMLASALFFLPFPGHSRLFPGALFPLNPVYWSLHFELIVNVLFAATIRHLGRRRLLIVVAASAVGALVCAKRIGSWEMGMSWSKASWIGGLFRTTLGFGIGVLLHRVPRPTGWQLPRWALAMPLLATVVVLGLPYIRGFGPEFDLMLVVGVLPLVVLGASKEPSGFRSPVLSTLGLASYPIYVFHKPVGDVVFHWFPRLISRNAPVSGAILLLALVLMALGLLRAWDAPVRRRLMRWAQTERASDGSAGPPFQRVSPK